MARRPPRMELLPERVTRLLATDGSVRLVAGRGENKNSLRAAVAPFDDMLVIFASPSSASLERLLWLPAVEVHAGGGERSWSLRMEGRAVATGRVTAHPRRSELLPWLPASSKPHRLWAVEFLPERIELVEGRGGNPERYEGATDAAKVPRPMARWLRAMFQRTWPLAALGAAVVWAWVGWWGGEYRLRPLALLSALAVVAGLMGGLRLVVLARTFLGWQEGRFTREETGPLGEGLLGARTASLTGGVLFALALPLLLFMKLAWGPTLVLVTLAASQVWYLLPMWVAHLLQRRPEAD